MKFLKDGCGPWKDSDAEADIIIMHTLDYEINPLPYSVFCFYTL